MGYCIATMWKMDVKTLNLNGILRITFCFTVCLGLVVCAEAQIPGWENLGLYGGAGLRIAVDPLDASHIFLATGSQAVNSYITTDSGDNWTKLPVHGRIVLYDPNATETIYLGRYKSIDNGETWAHLSALGPEDSADSLPAVAAVKPGDSTTLIAAHNDSYAKLLRSTDSGATWQSKTPAGITSAVWSLADNNIAFDPVDPNIMYIALEKEQGVDDAGLYKSTDSGDNWSRIRTQDCSSVLVHPTNSSLILVAGGYDTANCYRSSDGGSIWNEEAENVLFLVQDPTTDNKVIAFGEGVRVSTDFGLNWTESLEELINTPIGPYGVSVPETDSTKAYLASPEKGVYLLDLDGMGVIEKNQGISEIDVRDAIVSQDGQHIVVLSDMGINVTFDGGETWAITNWFTGQALCFDSETENTVYVAGSTRLGLEISSDGGNTWHNSTPEIPALGDTIGYSSIAESPDEFETLILGAFDWTGPVDMSTGGLYKSSDGGLTVNPTPLLQKGYVTEIEFESDSSLAARNLEEGPVERIVYCAVGNYADTSSNRGVYISEDSADTWTITGISDVNVTTIAADEADAKTVYAGVESEEKLLTTELLQRSNNKGTTWQGIFPAELEGHYAPQLNSIDTGTTAGVLYFASLKVGEINKGSIYSSSDYGDSWTVVAEDVEKPGVVIAGSLYAGMDGGLYKYSEPDEDGDGLSDEIEETIGTDPEEEDTDGDGMSDYEEVYYDGNGGYDPYHPIDNPDGTDLNALVEDTDGDGRTDGYENSFPVFLDPLDPTDGAVPVPATNNFTLILLTVIIICVGIYLLVRRTTNEQ